MFTIDNESQQYFKDHIQGSQALRIFFGGFG
jgi:hypothetical protein